MISTFKVFEQKDTMKQLFFFLTFVLSCSHGNYICKSPLPSEPFPLGCSKANVSPDYTTVLNDTSVHSTLGQIVLHFKRSQLPSRRGFSPGRAEEARGQRQTYFPPCRSSPCGTGRCAAWRACGSCGGRPHCSPAGCPAGRLWQHPGRRRPSPRWAPAAHSGSAAGRHKGRTEAAGGRFACHSGLAVRSAFSKAGRPSGTRASTHVQFSA